MKRELLLGLCLLSLVGCQARTEAAPTNTNEPFLEVQDFIDRTVTLDKQVERVAVLGNGELDLIYALGDEVVGRPTSKEPAVVKEAEDVPQVGTSHEVDLERLTVVQPDLVFANAPMNEKDIPVIEGIGAEVLLTSANNIQEIQDQIELFGKVLDNQERADELIQVINEKLDRLAQDKLTKTPNVLLVYGAPGSNMAALPNSLAGDILEKAGGKNVAASFEQLESFPQYAQLNSERVIEANPDVIFFMAHGDPESAEEGFIKEMEQHAAWSQLTAVKEGRLNILPSELFGTNPGTRITESLDYMRSELEEASQQ
ncbi:ABC transporter substrate-binding protein [Alkalicoccobacillus gibsonii]|uniref:ABC transporter substrate-binding protein n=1 Tax=Alkalicoccobacillus gibsonii TaxID=79881 RepID=UPI00351524CB